MTSILLMAALACSLLPPGSAGATPGSLTPTADVVGTAAPATAEVAVTPLAAAPTQALADQPVLTADEIAAVGAGLPTDGADAALALVALIHGTDERTALAATAELLRRSGLPLVALDGRVIALSDALVLADAEIYIDLVAELARATRRGDFYTPGQIAALLAEIGYGEDVLPPVVLVAGLGQWGKAPDAPAESVVASAAVRALAGRRLEVLYLGADLSLIKFDPLQTALILAHATSRTLPRISPVSLAPQAGGLRAAPVQQPGPCDALAQALEVPDQVQETMIEFMKGQIVDAWQEYALSEQARESLGKVTNVYEKGTAVLSTLLLILGAQLELSDNKGGATHFKHAEGDRSTHVTMLALAYFDSTIAQRQVACYKLAGIDVPPPGPLVGYRVRWLLAQTHGRGHQGKYLAAVPADSRKLDACGSCGEVTGPGGRSTLELYPPVEREPGKGVEFKGFAVVTASLDKDDFPFRLKDLLGLKNPAEFAASKTWDLAISALQRAGLPSQTRTIRVDYHGAEIYIVRGQKDVFALFATAPVLLDAYTCEGLNGRWQGIGGFGDIATYELWLEDFGADFPEAPADMRQLNFLINPEAAESIFDILPGTLTGAMRIDAGLIAANRAVVVNQSVGRPVGEVEVLLEGGTMDILGLGAPIFTVIWMPEDERCPGGGSYFENAP